MVHVAVIGAAGGIGQPLSLLLTRSLNPGSTLSLYDLRGVAGVAADLSHIDRAVEIRPFQGAFPPVKQDPSMIRAAEFADVIVIVAGFPRKPGMTRADLLKKNADVLVDIISTCARATKVKPFYCIVTNPVNTLVPIAAATLKRMGKYDPNFIVGVTQLDLVRAARFALDAREELDNPRPTSAKQSNAASVDAEGDVQSDAWNRHRGTPFGYGSSTDMSAFQVPVVGGHSEKTMVPLFSQAKGGPLAVPEAMRSTVTERVCNAGTVVVQAKAGAGSATLSMAHAAAVFVCALIEGLSGRAVPQVYAYVDTRGTHPMPYFSLPLLISTKGIQKRLPIGPVSADEERAIANASKILQHDIDEGNNYVKSKL